MGVNVVFCLAPLFGDEAPKPMGFKRGEEIGRLLLVGKGKPSPGHHYFRKAKSPDLESILSGSRHGVICFYEHGACKEIPGPFSLEGRK